MQTTRDIVLSAVLEQIKIDVSNGYFPAIAELLDNVPIEVLKGYLDETVLNDIISK